MEPVPGRKKNSGKWQRPRFTRKALMRCCLVKWILSTTTPQGQGKQGQGWRDSAAATSSVPDLGQSGARASCYVGRAFNSVNPEPSS
ncbi:hypothetical protein AALO_G00072050 [Alosa alosa]|uniref:Uncharacterized protein n=1 Tax=Alosa alosa TaxID=278164 RepID=A0AAV6H7P5_9TELE|nr:hypothetical protein AALO_G00072050 [Alosa alosa]